MEKPARDAPEFLERFFGKFCWHREHHGANHKSVIKDVITLLSQGRGEGKRKEETTAPKRLIPFAPIRRTIREVLMCVAPDVNRTAIDYNVIDSYKVKKMQKQNITFKLPLS